MNPPIWLRFGFEVESKGDTPAWFSQEHTRRTICLDGLELGSPHAVADAGFTRDRGKSLHVFTADCVPVLLHGETEESPIAAIHAGWRGTLEGILPSTLQAWGYPLSQTRAIVGPSIGKCCFEVKQDLVAAFYQKGFDISAYLEQKKNRLYFDLVRFLLKTNLLGAASVDTSRHQCTVCGPLRLPSYRRNGSTDPRIRSWIRKI